MKARYFIFLCTLTTLFLTNNSFCINTSYLLLFSENEYDEANAREATLYNASNALLSLPQKISHQILLESMTSYACLEDDIKEALKLSLVSKQFNKLSPQDIRQYLSRYSQQEKDTALQKLHSKVINDTTYENKRKAGLILTHAGAYCSDYFEAATRRSDSEMIHVFFAHKANPNQRTSLGPIFFRAKNVEIAKIFIAQGVDINMSHGPFYTNVLWANILHNPSAELIRLYLEHGADAKKIASYTGNCIFHYLAEIRRVIIENHNDYIMIGELLFDAASDMINTLNKENQTPLDFLMTMPHDCWNKELISPLIALFKKHGAKTAQQLKNESLSSSLTACCKWATQDHPAHEYKPVLWDHGADHIWDPATLLQSKDLKRNS